MQVLFANQLQPSYLRGARIVDRTKSIIDMPLPHGKYAPKKFRGTYSDIKLFLKHYEKLCEQTMSILIRRSVGLSLGIA